MSRRRRHNHRQDIIEGEWKPVVHPPSSPVPNVEPGGRYDRETPIREPGLEPDYLVPLATSLTIAAGFALACIVIPMLWMDRSFWQAWRYGATAFVIVQVLSFLATRDIVERTIWQVETMVGADLDGSGEIGRPATVLEVYNEHERDRKRKGDTWQSIDRLHLSADPDKFKLFCEAVNAGASLSIGKWTGSSGPWSRSEYENLLDELTQRGLVELKDKDTPQLGRRLTDKGERVFAQIARKQLPKPQD